MDLGGRIRALRKENGLSLEQLSAKSGVALATLSRIENGKGTGTFRTHRRIAEALQIPITAMISNDFKAVEGSLNDGQTLDEKAPRARVTQDLAALAASLKGQDGTPNEGAQKGAPEPHKLGFFAKLFGRKAKGSTP